jgi:DUF1680 family protein
MSSLLLPLLLLFLSGTAFAQHAVEPFDLADVTLLDSPFKAAMERNRDYLLSLEPDRFLHNFRVIVGLPPKAPLYGGWEAPTTGAGRCLGHYLSALSLQFRATGDRRFKERIDYIVSELALCQQANRDGFLSAQEGVREVFTELAKGKGDALFKSRVPWYIQHKMLAGLRDAYQLAACGQAKEVLVRIADWAVETTRALDDTQFQIMMQREVGGIQEAFADVYAISGEPRHLALAQRFYHRKAQDPIASGEDKLAGVHANTQVPKYLGAARLYELTGDERSRRMAEFFWDRVVHHHSYVMGGNSEHEHFGPPDEIAAHLGTETAESCNTYNLLKLTRHLITWEPKVEQADYCERALYNHILASQEPRQGMFAYFISLKPGHFRIFSTPHDSFWCCVGTGMENHTRYGESIYFHDAANLYVNLFIPSELRWKEKGVVVRQETNYPESGTVKLKLGCAKPVRFALKLRYPGWAAAGFRATVNGEAVTVDALPGSYVAIDREWHDGDTVEADIPLRLRVEPTPDDPKKIAILYGPLVLGGQLGTEGIPIPYALNQTDYAQVPDPEVPVLVTDDRPVESWIEPVPGQSLTFRTKGVGRPNDVTLVPFYRQYYERSAVYWDVFTQAQWKQREAIYLAEQERRRVFEARIVDDFRPGEQQSETDHHLGGERTASGTGTSGRKWRHATGGWFSFDMKVPADAAADLLCTYWGGDGGNRTFDILIDGQRLTTEALKAELPGKHIEKTYALPVELTRGKNSVTVRFEARPENVAGGVFGCRTLRRE